MSDRPAVVVGHEGRPDKRAAQIARSIEAEIIGRGWPIGESLGSEQELQQRYRVSRSVLREAVRLVEHHRVALMRRGPGGGLLITEPDAIPATRAVVTYLEYRGITITDLLNARLLLEPLAASLAAAGIDEAGIARLRAIVAKTPSQDFPIVLAQQAKNPVLQVFIDVLMYLTRSHCPLGGSSAKPASVQVVNQTQTEHCGIAAAVTAGDSARAKTLSEHHVESVGTWLRAGPQRSRARRRRQLVGRDASHSKLAEVLAATIQDDIAASGWPVGSVVGSEVQLLQRYGVSRSVFREAVRLLEFHAVAQMRRGPGGGLVVSTPQAQASVDTIALYLQYRRPSREDLRAVREVIETDNVARIISRRTESGVQAFLDGYRSGGDEISDLPKASAAESSFHAGLAVLAGNPILELFLRVLIELLRRHSASPAQHIPSSSEVAEITRAHQRIVEAIVADDESLARYRTRRHLDAVASWWL